MPDCFVEFKEMRIVLDCTEVQLEICHCTTCCILTYYKGMHTAKVLVGISPTGLLTFVSDGFGGRTSDKACVEKSGMLNKLNSFRDDIMVDKSFNLDDICGKAGTEIVQPPFLRHESQLSAEDAGKTLKIARARVHVERAIQRMKVFKVLKGPIPWELVGSLDQILVTIAGIENLSSSILSEDRFGDNS